MLFVGEGWGKSAAAFGYANRSVGRGWRTLVVQFLKGDAWNTADAESGRRLGIEWPSFTRSLTWAQDDPVRLAGEAWRLAQEAMGSGDYGLVVLDEITHATSSGWLDDAEVAQGVRDREPATSVILTGRTASRRLRAVAGTVTRFDLAKHEGKRGILG